MKWTWFERLECPEGQLDGRKGLFVLYPPLQQTICSIENVFNRRHWIVLFSSKLLYIICYSIYSNLSATEQLCFSAALQDLAYASCVSLVVNKLHVKNQG